MVESPSNRRHFIVKHDLESLNVLPGFIWRTGQGEGSIPRRYQEVRVGDRWIAFAYTKNDAQSRQLSLVTGFYECERTAEYRDVPPTKDGRLVDDGKAWLIQGREFGEQPREAVGVKPIRDILGRNIWNNQGIIPIEEQDFNLIRQHTKSQEFETSKIPLLGREPENEQEVLASVAFGHKQLGIDKIIRVRKAFPDLLVQFEGSSDKVHVELEVYSEGFFSHGHHAFVSGRCFDGDKLPITVLCWIDNEKTLDGKRVQDCVHKVYELRSLIRNGKK